MYLALLFMLRMLDIVSFCLIAVSLLGLSCERRGIEYMIVDGEILEFRYNVEQTLDC